MLAHLETVFRPPTPLSNDEKYARMKIWQEACQSLPKMVFLASIAKHIKESKFFPTPAEIRTLSESTVEMLVHRAKEEAELRTAAVGGKVHEARLRPPMDPTFPLKMSHLRSNQNWQRFLNGIHPTAEHSFFVDCKMGQYEHELEGLSSFARDYIQDHWANEMYEVFGRTVVLKVAPRKQDFNKATAFKKEPPSPEASKRMSDLVKKWKANF